MNARKPVILITIGACIVGLSALGSLKNPVTRPLKAHGHGTLVADLRDGSLTAQSWSQSTLTGLTTTDSVGEMDPATMTPIWSEGTATAANGDQMFYEMTDPVTCAFTGGTGRFEGVTGVAIQGVSDVVVTVEGTIMTMTFNFTLDGSVTY
jgi:hypothetical protein